MKAGKLIHFSISHPKKHHLTGNLTMPYSQNFLPSPTAETIIFKFRLPEKSWLLSISMPTSYFPVLKRAHINHHVKTPTLLS